MHSSLWIVSAALLLSATGQTPEPRATPQARFADISATTPSDRALRAYFQSLRFVADSASGDRRVVAPGGGTATIQPEAGVHLLNEAAMREGRVIARILYSGRDPLPRVGWGPRSITYWWVKYDGTRGAAVMISTDSATGAVLSRTPVALWTDVHPSGAVPRALLTETNDLMVGCAPCPRLGWCGGDSTHSRSWADPYVEIHQRAKRGSR